MVTTSNVEPEAPGSIARQVLRTMVDSSAISVEKLWAGVPSGSLKVSPQIPPPSVSTGAGSAVAASATDPDPVQLPQRVVQQSSTDRSHRTPPAPPHGSDPSSPPCRLAAECSMATALHRHNHVPANRAAAKNQPTTLRHIPSALPLQSASSQSPVARSIP